MEIINKYMDLPQLFPMRTQLRLEKITEERIFFSALFSSDDFFRMDENKIPISYFLELLGQSAEIVYRYFGEDNKRYLAQILDFHLDPELYQYLDQKITICVNRNQKLGRFNKSYVIATIEGIQDESGVDHIFCEGSYVHCDE